MIEYQQLMMDVQPMKISVALPCLGLFVHSMEYNVLYSEAMQQWQI